jgi:hypothetical protein
MYGRLGAAKVVNRSEIPVRVKVSSVVIGFTAAVNDGSAQFCPELRHWLLNSIVVVESSIVCVNVTDCRPPSSKHFTLLLAAYLTENHAAEHS